MTATKINENLENINKWSKTWLVKFNSSKTVSLTVKNKHIGQTLNQENLLLDGQIIANVNTHKHLGVILNSNLTWTDHINYVCEKRLDAIRLLKYKCDRKTLEVFYFSFVRPILEYGQILYAGAF